MPDLISPSSLLPIVPLAVAWRLLTELQRRHGSRHELQVLRAHPGYSMDGQFVMLVDPVPGKWQQCDRLTLNLGGPTGSFEVRLRSGATLTGGDFLSTALMKGPADALAALERALGWVAPSTLPASTSKTVAMRLVAELLAGCWLDRKPLMLEHAWFDSSAVGCHVMSWAETLGIDNEKLDTGWTKGAISDHAVWNRMMGCVRLIRAGEGGNSCVGAPSFLVSLTDGIALLVGNNGGVTERMDLMAAYQQNKRCLEPIAGKLIAALRHE